MSKIEEILLVDSGFNNNSLNMLYDLLYDVLSNDEMMKCDEYIEEFVESNPSILLQVGFVRIIKTHKYRLENREILIDKLEKSLLKDNINKEEVNNILSTIV